MYANETQLQVRDMARQFAEEVVRPQAESLDRDERFPADIYAQMGELGLFGIGVPEAMGGPGFDTLTYALVMEELSRGYASVADQCGLVELISTLLVRHGTDAQRDAWLAPVMRATKRAAYCITEPEAGTDVSGIRTTAEKDGAAVARDLAQETARLAELTRLDLAVRSEERDRLVFAGARAKVQKCERRHIGGVKVVHHDG